MLIFMSVVTVLVLVSLFVMTEATYRLAADTDDWLILRLVMRGKSKEKTIPKATHVFEGIDTRDRRQVQSYLMEKWEQRFEAETGAHVLRWAIDTAQDECDQLTQHYRDHLEDSLVFHRGYVNLTKYFFNMPLSRLESEMQLLAPETLNVFRERHMLEIHRKNREIEQLTHGWAKRMRLPPSSPLHQYKTDPMWAFIPLTTPSASITLRIDDEESFIEERERGVIQARANQERVFDVINV